MHKRTICGERTARPTDAETAVLAAMDRYLAAISAGDLDTMASMQTPYEFWIDGKTSHCGIDVFSFIKVGDEWHVANSTWTVEPDACPELRPSDPAGIRPAG